MVNRVVSLVDQTEGNVSLVNQTGKEVTSHLPSILYHRCEVVSIVWLNVVDFFVVGIVVLVWLTRPDGERFT